MHLCNPMGYIHVSVNAAVCGLRGQSLVYLTRPCAPLSPGARTPTVPSPRLAPSRDHDDGRVLGGETEHLFLG